MRHRGRDVLRPVQMAGGLSSDSSSQGTAGVATEVSQPQGQKQNSSSSSRDRNGLVFDGTLPGSLEVLLRSALEKQQLNGVEVSSRYKAFASA